MSVVLYTDVKPDGRSENKRDKNALSAFEMKCYRRILRKHIRWQHKVTNKEIRSRVGTVRRTSYESSWKKNWTCSVISVECKNPEWWKTSYLAINLSTIQWINTNGWESMEWWMGGWIWIWIWSDKLTDKVSLFYIKCVQLKHAFCTQHIRACQVVTTPEPDSKLRTRRPMSEWARFERHKATDWKFASPSDGIYDCWTTMRVVKLTCVKLAIQIKNKTICGN